MLMKAGQEGDLEMNSPNSEEETVEEIEIDIPEDAYGAGILAIVHDIVVIRSGSWRDEEVRLGIIQASFAVLLLIVNLGMQFALLYFIWVYVVEPSVHHVQLEYANFHKNVFDTSGVFLPDAWARYDHKESLCEIGLSNQYFYWLVIFLWVLLIIKEFRTTEELMRDVCFQVPSCDDIHEMIREGKDKKYVVALTTTSRVLCFIFVILPKFLICCTLMWLGCQWLTATSNFTDLVMNSIAMEFVTRVDENLYETILPAYHRQQVEEINFLVEHRFKGRRKEFNAFRHSFIYFILGIAFVLLYSGNIQSVLPGNVDDVTKLCSEYQAQKPKFECRSSWWLGTAGMQNCFPFGSQ